MTVPPEPDALDRLADVLVEDTLETPGHQLLAEVAEDYGEAEVLSADFDRLVCPIVQRLEAERVDLGQSASSRRFGDNSINTGRSQETSGQPSASSLTGWLKALLNRALFLRTTLSFPGNFQAAAASLLVVALIASVGVLVVKQHSLNNVSEQTASPILPPARGYFAQVGASRSEPEARANYHDLQEKFPSLLEARSPLIRLRERGGTDDRSYIIAVGPFPTIEQAEGLCQKLKSSGTECSAIEYGP